MRTSFTSWQTNVEPTAVSQVIAYVDPTRSIDTYMMSLDQTGGMAEFIAAARDLSDADWNPVYQAAHGDQLHPGRVCNRRPRHINRIDQSRQPAV